VQQLGRPSQDEKGEPISSVTTVNVDAPNGHVDPNWQEVDLGRQSVKLEIGEQEIALLEALSGFVPTPRGAKRLANVYRLLKASSYINEAGAFEGTDDAPAEFPVVMLLAAIATGFPNLMQTVFERLALTAVPQWRDFVNELARAWESSIDDVTTVDSTVIKRSDGRGTLLLELLQAIESLLTTSDISVYKRWAPRIAQFSFVGGLGRGVIEA
jgi:hypothetical protein